MKAIEEFIKNLLNEKFLNEAEGKTVSYRIRTMINIPPKENYSKKDDPGLIKKAKKSVKDLASDGKRVDPGITVKYDPKTKIKTVSGRREAELSFDIIISGPKEAVEEWIEDEFGDLSSKGINKIK